MSLDLDHRAGLPEELRYLAAAYPRELWPEHANLGETARFWLQRHDMFRELGGRLNAATAAYRSGVMTAEEYRRFTPRRLQFFLGQLHTHHMIEDHHYFPVFLAAERGLARGFELLDADHHAIDARLHEVAATANALFARLAGEGGDARAEADAHAAAGERLIAGLMRHLEDEEDLIVPVILDRGEQALGMP